MTTGDKVRLDGRLYTIVRIVGDRAYLRDSLLRYRTAAVADLKKEGAK